MSLGPIEPFFRVSRYWPGAGAVDRACDDRTRDAVGLKGLLHDGRGLAVVHTSSMSYSDDDDHKNVVFDLIYDAIHTDAYSVSGLA